MSNGIGANQATLRRWRLVLGRYSDGGLRQPRLTELELRTDRALEYLYGRELDRRGIRSRSGARHGSLDASQLTTLDWLREVRELFPATVYETIQGHALDRYGMSELLRDPQLLAGLTPSEDLLRALMTLKDRADPALQAKIREIARKVMDDIMRRLKSRVETALSGTRNRFASSPLKNIRNFDWRRTIRENLKHYDATRRVLVAERLRFHARSRRRFPWTIVLCVDQSGSMVSSVIYSAVMAAIIAGLPSLRLHLVVFDTAIVDLTDRAADPVEVLLSVQLGGGTDIGRAVNYCEQLIQQPTRTVFVLVSDFCEGGSPGRLVTAVRRLAEAVPDFDRGTAGRLADAGMKIAALTPERFADWLAEVIQ